MFHRSCRTHSGRLTLIAGCLVTFTLGSVHAFSVFVLPLESFYSVGRSSVSFVYSLALLSLTIMVFFGHRFYGRCSPPNLTALACIVAGLGLLIAGTSSSLIGVYVGYGVLFGAANGIGYGFVLQLVAQGLPSAAGAAMGIVTALYAIGAAVFAKIFTFLLQITTLANVMGVMAFVLFAVAIIVWLLLYCARAIYEGDGACVRASFKRLVSLFDISEPSIDLIRRLWLAYGTAVAAGLMVIGHATGIVIERGGQSGGLFLGIVTISAGNALGGILVGLLVDRFPPQKVLMVVAVLSVLALGLLLGVSTEWWTIFALGAVGVCYGATIAIYPVIVVFFYGFKTSARIYGVVFTAWGVAGLVLPWTAGFLFDLLGNYYLAIAMALVLSMISSFVVFSLPHSPDEVQASR